jgi:homoserine O-acetyltransferase
MVIGGSLGGGIAWEMAALKPELIEHLVPIAADWQSTDWLIANCRVQEQILNNSKDPVHDARLHAMLCYRTPVSFRDRFERTINEDLGIFNVESWLLHHGNKLRDRFSLETYKLNNQLLKTIDIGRDGPKGIEAIKGSKINIHIIGVNSDLFFTIKENRETFNELADAGCEVTYGEINSKYGHDAFLIEFEQLADLLYLLFKSPRKTPKINNQLTGS